MVRPANDLWSMIWNQHWLPPEELWQKVQRAAIEPDLDSRSQLLIRDCLNALAIRIGDSQLRERIRATHDPARIDHLWSAHFDEPGFPSLENRIVEPLSQPNIDRFFTYLGGRLRQPTTIIVGGSISLMLAGIIARQTEDVDVVDDIPDPIRRDHQLMDDLRATQKLSLGHFASHYLPEGWEGRVKYYQHFDRLTVKLIDPLDVLVGKVFSLRNKDLLDLQEAWAKLDQAEFRSRLERFTRGLRTVGYLAERSKLNWKVLTGEADLPPLISE